MTHDQVGPVPPKPAPGGGVEGGKDPHSERLEVREGALSKRSHEVESSLVRRKRAKGGGGRGGAGREWRGGQQKSRPPGFPI